MSINNPKSAVSETVKESEPIDNYKTREIYFIIIYPRIEDGKSEELIFKKKDNLPQCIYTTKIGPNNEQKNMENIKVFKLIHTTKEKKSVFYEFNIGENQYEVSFEIKNKIFIYDLTLKLKRTILFTKTDIVQKTIDYFEKMIYFTEALTEKKETEKIDNLYEETILLYTKKISFSFLIRLFIKVYDKKKFCKKLLQEFSESISEEKNEKKNGKKNLQKNMDRPQNLEQYRDTFKNINLNSNQLIKENEYDPIDFYGIILIYFNYYYYDEFIDLTKKL